MPELIGQKSVNTEPCRSEPARDSSLTFNIYVD